jgi:ferredoxin
MSETDKQYKIIYHKDECIGAFACVAAEPNHWEQNGAKADLIDYDEETDETYIKYVDDIGNNLEAAQSCPVNCIHIVDLENDKELI